MSPGVAVLLKPKLRLVQACLDADMLPCAVITDPMDPKFDLEAYLTMKQAEEK